MAAKYQLITELYRRTGVAVTKNPQAWQGFLAAACRNYKCRFDEQLLIYAQRPDAVAVAQLETWNKQFRRWVNKDSKGIEQYEGQYRAAMYAAVKSANPNWKPGQKFDTSILDNVTRESVESTLVKNGNRLVRNSIDVSV